MSISSLFSAARSGLQAAQLGLQETSNNIANANTPGYSRQEALQVSTFAEQRPYGEIGTGVNVVNVVQLRDTLLDASYRSSNSVQAGASQRNSILGQVENVFNEPSTSGLGNAIDQFWSSWSDLANDPTNSANKKLVQQRGDQMTGLFHSISTQLGIVTTQTADNANLDLTNFNTYTDQLAKLNVDIVAAESGGQSAPSLRDQRNLLLDKLSAIAPVSASVDGRGSLTVYLGGISIVDGSTAKALAITPIPGPPVTYQLGVVGQTGNINNSVGISGTLAANLALLNTELPSFQNRMDALASGIVSKVNALHVTGWSAAGDALGGSNWPPSPGPTGSRVNFFTPTGATAAGISVSSQVESNSDVIAAGSAQNTPGQSDVAQAIAALRGDTTAITQYNSTQTTSLDGYFRGMITDLGTRVADSNQVNTVFTTIAKNANTRRESVSGVSTDDEMVKLIKYQQAYAAAGKTISAAQAMTQSLLDMIH